MNTTSQFKDWEASRIIVEKMIPLIGKLYRDNNIRIFVCGYWVIDYSAVGILSIYFTGSYCKTTFLKTSLAILELLENCSIQYLSIDICLLVERFLKQSAELSSFVFGEIAHFETNQLVNAGKRDIVLYGFGRIGRLLMRLFAQRSSRSYPLSVRAIVVRDLKPGDLEKRSELLKNDSVHGAFLGTVEVNEACKELIVNGNRVHVISAVVPEEIDYTEYGINNALIIDNTGCYSSKDALERHLLSKGASQVLLTAPAKGDVKTIVMGVNHDVFTNDSIISAASCTTNAVAPVLKALHNQFELLSGHIETVHAYTNDQNLTDNYHPKHRRGRSAPLNIVITKTGAAKALGKVLPNLSEKLTGSAIRVPVANVSVAILNLQLKHIASCEEVCKFLKYIAHFSLLKEQVEYSQSLESVSSDFLASPFAGIIDGPSTQVSSEGNCVAYVWYDNEFGYVHQVLRLVEKICGVDYHASPRLCDSYSSFKAFL